MTNKYRIRENIMGDGRSKYQVQKRKAFIFWVNVDGEEYNRMDHAKEKIFELTRKERAGTLVKTKVHVFDETFERLKKKKEEADPW